LVEDIRRNLADKSNDELVQIWKENNHERWSDSAFEAVRQTLTERGIKLPPQDPPKEVNLKKAAPQRSKLRTSARVFIVLVSVWWLMVIAGLIREQAPSDSSLIGGVSCHSALACP
jgi:ferric-dicitrate binding protein FerR (iron transport regulator)